MKLGKLVRSLCWTAALAACVASISTESRASIVERVVAIVGERPILLSELRHRGRPFQYRILATTQNATQQAAAETEMYRELLNRMIDDRLEEQAADKAHLTVTPDDVDGALRNVANSARITVKDLLNEAKHQGLTEQDYRDEIRRQVLEGKLVQLRVRGRVRVTDEDAKQAYAHWVKDMADQEMVDPSILALRIAQGSTEQEITNRMLFASMLANDARTGKTSWCDVIKQYTDDGSTRETCGSRGPQSRSSLVPELQRAYGPLKEGEISDPIRVGNEAILLAKKTKDVKVPLFEEVKDQMTERAFGEAMERQRKQWLLELRRGVYIDVRL